MSTAHSPAMALLPPRRSNLDLIDPPLMGKVRALARSYLQPGPF